MTTPERTLDDILLQLWRGGRESAGSYVPNSLTIEEAKSAIIELVSGKVPAKIECPPALNMYSEEYRKIMAHNNLVEQILKALKKL